jgi:hypothetical protein
VYEALLFRTCKRHWSLQLGLTAFLAARRSGLLVNDGTNKKMEHGEAVLKSESQRKP